VKAHDRDSMNVKIEKLIYGGDGLAHHEGATVFVPFVLPGEEAAVRPVEQKKKFVRGELERILQASPERVPAPCPHFGTCGGCHYQHLPYDAQLRYKTEILRETLRRLGRIDWPGEITAHASPPWQYRNRAQWKVRIADKTAATEKLVMGYFRAGSTALCPVEECPVLSPRLYELFQALRAAIVSDPALRSLREAEAFADSNDRKILLNLQFAKFPSSAENLAESLRSALPGAESVLIQDLTGQRMALAGPGFLTCQVAESAHRVSHLSFFQVNRFLFTELAQTAVRAAGEGQTALDLFAGVGLFSLPLAKQFQRVIAVEASPVAARDLKANATAQNLSLDVREEDVENFLHGWKRTSAAGTPDVIVIDPPRAGLTPPAVARLARIASVRIVYISCEPSTLARDLAALTTNGYVIRSIDFFDMFPQTFHIETLVHLERTP
jgi:23S rRNA (uracil1939-C5)-methyltransferase